MGQTSYVETGGSLAFLYWHHLESMTTGRFNYLSDSVKPSLYRNGEVSLRRFPDGTDGDVRGLAPSGYEMPVHNARALPQREVHTLARSGFELATRSVPSPVDFLDLRAIVRDYYPHCEQTVEEAVGGRAYAFDHNVRSAQGKRSRQEIAGGQRVQEPLHMVHGDYTLTSGPQRLRDLAAPPSSNDTLRTVLEPGQSLIPEAAAKQALNDGGRFAIINVWRNVAPEPVETHPLALCDSSTVDPADLVVFELHYEDRIGENYLAKHAARHCWYYFPAMTGDEALLIKQWDSAGGLARSSGQSSDANAPDATSTFSFHSAFEDPNTADDAPDRMSIEVRCMVLFD